MTIVSNSLPKSIITPFSESVVLSFGRMFISKPKPTESETNSFRDSCFLPSCFSTRVNFHNIESSSPDGVELFSSIGVEVSTSIGVTSTSVGVELTSSTGVEPSTSVGPEPSPSVGVELEDLQFLYRLAVKIGCKFFPTKL